MVVSELALAVGAGTSAVDDAITPLSVVLTEGYSVGTGAAVYNETPYNPAT